MEYHNGQALDDQYDYDKVVAPVKIEKSEDVVMVKQEPEPAAKPVLTNNDVVQQISEEKKN